MELLMTDANNTALYYANLKTATVDKIQYFRQNANLLSRGRVALLWQYLKTIDELWQQTNDVIQVMSKSEPCVPTFLDSNSSIDSDLFEIGAMLTNSLDSDSSIDSD